MEARNRPTVAGGQDATAAVGRRGVQHVLIRSEFIKASLNTSVQTGTTYGLPVTSRRRPPKTVKAFVPPPLAPALLDLSRVYQQLDGQIRSSGASGA